MPTRRNSLKCSSKIEEKKNDQEVEGLTRGDGGGAIAGKERILETIHPHKTPKTPRNDGHKLSQKKGRSYTGTEIFR